MNEKLSDEFLRGVVEGDCRADVFDSTEMATELLAIRARCERLEAALKRLSEATGRLAFAAETSGGTAGRDDGLCAELDRIADPLGQARAIVAEPPQ